MRALLRAALVAAASLNLPIASPSADDFSFSAPNPKEGKPEVVNGTPQDPATWPATMILKVGIEGCTATVVGPNVILTAAHCLKSASKGKVNVPGSAAIDVTCTKHPAYTPTSTDPNTALDFALCVAADTIKLAGSAGYERIGTDRALTVRGTSVLLLGYGCTETGGFDHGFGVLHRGKAKIDRVTVGSTIYLLTVGENAVCYGDSGGATYALTDMNNNRRVIIGVNSRGNIVDSSFISPTATDEFVEWAFVWAQANDNALLCGLHPATPNCRSN